MEIKEKRTKMMGEEKVSKVLVKLAIPGIIAMLINAIYNFVDTLFVGMLGNTSAMAAVSSLAFALMNQAANPYGDSAVAGIGIGIKAFVIGMFLILGYNQGFQPVVGYNYGAKSYNRLFESVKVALKHTTIIATVSTIFFLLFSKEVVSLFTNDREVIMVGARFLKAMSLLFPFFGFQQVCAVLFQGLGKGKQAFVLSIARQGLFLVPSIIILPRIFELNGVIFSQTVADFFTILITGIFAIKINKELNEENENISGIDLKEVG
ncbi:MATE family efflux transporter [Dethiothermospora halolimnae]|uniref:MATE family efflux transporter n=1 Tax=Dethiothermospora halolimnae TaxID=3114390 RepID=UPI003CCBF5C6